MGYTKEVTAKVVDEMQCATSDEHVFEVGEVLITNRGLRIVHFIHKCNDGQLLAFFRPLTIWQSLRYVWGRYVVGCL